MQVNKEKQFGLLYLGLSIRSSWHCHNRAAAVHWATTKTRLTLLWNKVTQYFKFKHQKLIVTYEALKHLSNWRHSKWITHWESWHSSKGNHGWVSLWRRLYLHHLVVHGHHAGKWILHHGVHHGIHLTHQLRSTPVSQNSIKSKEFKCKQSFEMCTKDSF